MRKEDNININGIQIAVKELTVAEVRHWMMDLVQREETNNNSDTIEFVIDQAFFDDIGISDVLRMTDLSSDLIKELTPSQLRLVIARCKALNPDFFGMRKRVLGPALSRA